MPLSKRVDGLGEDDGPRWPLVPVQGVSAAEMGFDLIDADAWDYFPWADGTVEGPPPGSESPGYLETTSAAARFFRLDTASFPGADPHYWMRAFCRADVPDPSALPDAGQSNSQQVYFGSGTSDLECRLYLHNDSAPGPVGDWSREGVQFAMKDFRGTPTNTDLHTFPMDTASTPYASRVLDGPTPIRWGEWFEIVVHVYQHATNGYVEAFANGMLVSETRNFDTTPLTAWHLRHGGQASTLAGGRAIQYTGPFETWYGTDIQVLPRTDLEDPAEWNGRAWPIHWSANVAGLSQGRRWLTFAGSPVPKMYDELEGGGFRIQRRKLEIQPNDGTTIVSGGQVGALPFNPDGWTTVLFPYLLPRTIGDATFELRQAEGQTSSSIFSSAGNFEINEGVWQFGGVPLAGAPAIENENHYTLAIHLKQGGSEVRWSIYDLSGDYGVAQRAASGLLPDTWSNGSAIGIAWISFGTANNLRSFGGMEVCRYFVAAGIDSMACNSVATTTGSCIQWTHIPARMLPDRDVYSVPGGAGMEVRRALANPVLERFRTNVPIGRPGRTRTQWTESVLRHIGECAGGVFLMVDGGSVNDVGSVNEGNYADKLETFVSELDEMLDALTPRNVVWLTTMLHRDIYYGAVQNRFISDLNDAIRARRGRRGVIFSDVEATFTRVEQAELISDDDLHTNNSTGDIAVARAILETATVGGAQGLVPAGDIYVGGIANIQAGEVEIPSVYVGSGAASSRGDILDNGDIVGQP